MPDTTPAPTTPQTAAPSPLQLAELTAGLLQEVLAENKIKGIVTLSWSGPQIDTYTVNLGIGIRPARVMDVADALAIAAGATSCRVSLAAGGILLLEIPKPEDQRQPLRAARLEALQPPAPTAACAGIATGGRAVWLDLNDERYAHLVLGGITGSGKTELVKWLLYRWTQQLAPSDLDLLLLDPKGTELKIFARLPHLRHPIQSDPAEIARTLAWAVAEMDRRARSGISRPYLLIVIEEVADLLSVNKGLAAPLTRIAQVGRALGIHLLCTTQQPGAKALGDASINFTARIIGRVGSRTLTYGATGRKGTFADDLLGRGDLLLVAAGETVRFQAPLTGGQQWLKLPRTSAVRTLDNELPTLAYIADLQRDPRGGRDSRPLTRDDYTAIEADIRAGQTVDQIRSRYNIGYERANRIYRTTLDASSVPEARR